MILDQDIAKISNLSNVSFLKNVYEQIKIRDRKFQPLFNQTIGVCITKISVLLGFKNEIDPIIKQDLLRFVKNNLDDLTIEEIYKAFELERDGNYPNRTEHFQLFDVTYFSTVIKKYREWKNITKTQHNITKNLPEKNELSNEEKQKIVINGILACFSHYKETSELFEPNTHYFDELVLLGLIRGRVNEKGNQYYDEMLEQAKRIVEIEENERLEKTLGKSQREAVRNAIADIEKNKNPKLFIVLKKLVLKDFFKKAIEKNIDLEKMINDKLKQNDRNN